MTFSSKEKNIARIQALISGILMGTVGIFVSNLPNSWIAVCARGLFGFLFIFLILLFTKNLKIIKVFRNSLVYVILTGLNNVIVISCYFYGITTVGMGIAAFLLYTNGIFGLFFMRIFLNEKIKLFKWICFGIAIFGVLIIMEPWNSINPIINNTKIIGYSSSLASGIFLGLDFSIKKKIFKIIRKDQNYLNNYSGKFNIGLVNIALVLFTTIFLFIFTFPFLYKYILNFNFNQLIISILLGIIPTAIPFAIFNYSLTKDEGGDIIILTYIEPIVACILGAVFYSELKMSTLLGGIFIVLANIIILLNDKNN